MTIAEAVQLIKDERGRAKTAMHLLVNREKAQAVREEILSCTGESAEDVAAALVKVDTILDQIDSRINAELEALTKYNDDVNDAVDMLANMGQ